MTAYTITIAPDDRTQATTTLRVEVTGTGTRIIELVVQAGEGPGLNTGQFPSVDIDTLLRAVAPANPTVMVANPAAAGPPGGPPAGSGQSRQPKLTAASRATSAGRQRGIQTTARSYRRAPADLAAVLARTGSATAIANHYQVPKYTAESWIRTMRRRSAGKA